MKFIGQERWRRVKIVNHFNDKQDASEQEYFYFRQIQTYPWYRESMPLLRIMQDSEILMNIG